MNTVIEAFYLCLAASLVWAPLVFFAASALRRRAPEAETAIWPGALAVAVLPALAAPVAAAFGLSLRAAKPLPPMAAPDAVAGIGPLHAAAPVMEPTGVLDLAAAISAAAALYFYGFILFAALGLIRIAGFSWRTRRARPATDPRLLQGLEDWRRAMGIRRPVRYRLSDAVSSVCVHGVFRPVILMPPALLARLSTADAVLMGAHEMAHIRRGDAALYAACSLAAALFWFNPVMGRIAACARLAAEQAADALVIARGVSRRAYARCFVEGLKASAGIAPRTDALAPSFTPFDRRSRRARLDAILSGRTAGAQLGGRMRLALGASLAAALALAFAQAAYAVSPRPARDALTHVPVSGKITAPFGDIPDPFTDGMRHHDGIDIRAAKGTPVKAAGSGKVIDATARYKGGEAWGKVVVIDHGHGLVTRYAHLDSYAVEKGDSVKGGAVIGAVGATGKATGPHLHFEVWLDGAAIDPAPIAAPEAAPAAPAAPSAPSREAALAPLAPTELAAAPPPPAAPERSRSPRTIGDRLEQRLGAAFADLGAKIDADLSEVDIIAGLDDVKMRLGDLELKGLDGLEELAESLRQEKLDFGDIDTFSFEAPNLAFSWDTRAWSEERREAMERSREEAIAAAEKAREAAERERERMRETLARAEKDQREQLRELEREARDQARAARARQKAETLRLKEKALRDAERALERERKAIEKRRAELEEERRALEEEKRRKD